MKKRSITLLEIMIVILLIGLIGGVVSYNLKGTLDKGKAFSSREGAKKLEDILNLELQQSQVAVKSLLGDEHNLGPGVVKTLTDSGLLTDTQAKKFVKDGWKEFYVITQVGDKNEVAVSSVKLDAYDKDHPSQN